MCAKKLQWLKNFFLDTTRVHIKDLMQIEAIAIQNLPIFENTSTQQYVYTSFFCNNMNISKTCLIKQRPQPHTFGYRIIDQHGEFENEQSRCSGDQIQKIIPF